MERERGKDGDGGRRCAHQVAATIDEEEVGTNCFFFFRWHSLGRSVGRVATIVGRESQWEEVGEPVNCRYGTANDVGGDRMSRLEATASQNGAGDGPFRRRASAATVDTHRKNQSHTHRDPVSQKPSESCQATDTIRLDDRPRLLCFNQSVRARGTLKKEPQTKKNLHSNLIGFHVDPPKVLCNRVQPVDSL